MFGRSRGIHNGQLQTKAAASALRAAIETRHSFSDFA